MVQMINGKTSSPWKPTLVVALVLTVFHLSDGDYTLEAPSIHWAFSGDVSVNFQIVDGSPTLSFGVVQLFDITEPTDSLRATKNLPSTQSGNIYFECSYFDHKGEFDFRILAEENGPILATSNTVYVYWPSFRIASPLLHVEALTEDVAVTIYTDERICGDMSHNRYETSVTLMYHGGQQSQLTSNELPTPAPTDGIIADEFPTGIIGSEDQVQFYCNAIDRAGFFTFEYQSTFNRSVIARSSFLQVYWSDAYKVISPQENIFPCSFDNGFEITYEYPRCRGEKDKIRVFGQKDVFSRVPAAGSLEYITEQGAYDIKSVFFFCDHFSKQYKGYCFRYVSVARNGAVDDHAMMCIPTNGTGPPLNGAWSSWLEWGDCTVSCGEGIRYRVRLCNNPTPVNGGAPCEGDTVDSESCSFMACPTVPPDPVTFPHPDKGINVIPGCNCGCILRQINGTISSSPNSCTNGFGAWKVVVADDLRIRLDFRSFDLYLHDEWLRIRDGEDEGARVIAYHTGSKLPKSITSSRNKLFLEYKVSERETGQIRGFSAVYLTFDNPHYITPVIPIAGVGKQEDTKKDSSLPLGSVTNLVMILAVIFCTFVIVLSITCTTYAGWKRQKRLDMEGREDSGLTGGFRSSASGHSIEPSARILAKSGSSASELSNYSNNQRGCPDGRYMDRSSLYMVKDETGLTYLPESNLSSPSYADEGSKQLLTIPEDRIPPNPYEEGQDNEEDVARYEVGLPYHLGPGSVSELSERHTVRSDANTAEVSMRSHDKHGSQNSHSVRGSQSSMLGCHTGTGYSSRSHRSGSGSRSFDRSNSSISQKYGGDPLSPTSPQEGDFRVLQGSENPDGGRSQGARRKRNSYPSSSNSAQSHRSSHNSNRSHQNKGHHRSHSSSDSKRSDSNRRHRHSREIQPPDLSQRPRVVGESPTTKGPSNLYRPSRMSFHEDQVNRTSPVVESSADMWDHRRHSKPRKHHHNEDDGDKTPTAPPTSTGASVFLNFGYSANLGLREPICPGKSPSTECPSDISRESKHSPNNSNQNQIDTLADIEQPPSDSKHKKHGKHKGNKSRHKRDGKKSSSGSAEDDPKLALRLANHSNGYLDQDTTDVQSESARSSDPSVTSPLHYSYLNSKQRPDYMKSVFISDESLARTHSGHDSNHTSRTATPSMAHRKMSGTPTLSSGPSSPSKSLMCVPIYSDADGVPDGVSNDGSPQESNGRPVGNGVSYDSSPPESNGRPVGNGASFDSSPESNGKPASSVAPLVDLEMCEFDDLSPVHMMHVPPEKPKHVSTLTNQDKKLEKSESEKEEVVRVGSEKDYSPPQVHKDAIINGTNGTKPASAVRRTRPRRGPLSAASFV